MDFFKDIKPLTKYTGEQEDNYFRNTQEKTTTSSSSYSTEPIRPAPVKTLRTDDIRYYPTKDSFSSLDASYKKSKQHHSGRGIWFFAFLGVIILALVLSSQLSTAHIYVTPKLQTIPIDETLKLSKDSAPVSFDTTSVTSDTFQNQTLSKKEVRADKASGSITIYNGNSATPQKLIKNTQMLSPAGVLYRLDNEVMVPGYKMIEGKKVPGSTHGTVTAVEPGESGNLAEGILTVKFFKGTAKESTVYGKLSKPISGGRAGEYYVSENVEEGNLDGQKTVLTQKLRLLIEKQIPDDYIYIDGMNIVDIADSNQSFSKTPEVQSGLTGTLTQIVFPKSAFDTYMKKSYSDLSDLESIDTKDLKGEVVSQDGTAENTVYTVHIGGTIVREVPFSVDELKNALAGVKKGSFTETMNKIPNISKAELHIVPFWVSTIPRVFNRITIIKVNG